MAVRLHMLPNQPPLTRAEFCSFSPPFGAALDGFCADGPWFDPEGPRVNFNHHEGCVRLATHATCGQILIAIRQGFFLRFRNQDGIQVEVFANDCDEDVCVSWFLLNHDHLVESAMNPVLNRLVSLEDALDSTAGSYPLPRDLPALRELAWIFDPYRRMRLNGGLDRRDPQEFVGVVTDVEHRIMQHISGRGQELPLDTRYERIGGGTGWVMVREIGAQARLGMHADGIKAFVSVRERPDGRWNYVAGKTSPYIPLDLASLVEQMNILDQTGQDRWGGNVDSIIGSPRIGGSGTPPDKLAAVLSETACH